MPFIYQAVDKLHLSNRILKLVEELKLADKVNPEDINTAEMAKAMEQKEQVTAQEVASYYPESYLSSVIGDDHFLLTRVKVEEAKKDEGVNEVQKQLMGENAMHPLALKGPEHDDFYVLGELEQRNIKTVLIENLFTELAVMYFFISEIVEHEKQQ